MWKGQGYGHTPPIGGGFTPPEWAGGKGEGGRVVNQGAYPAGGMAR